MYLSIYLSWFLSYFLCLVQLKNNTFSNAPLVLVRSLSFFQQTNYQTTSFPVNFSILSRAGWSLFSVPDLSSSICDAAAQETYRACYFPPLVGFIVSNERIVFTVAVSLTLLS